MNRNQRIVFLTVILVGFAAVRTYVSVVPRIPQRQRLEQLPNQIGDYRMLSESHISDDVQAVLKADDYVLRTYRNRTGDAIEVFVAYYEYQRAGESMHSPKNCLPGSGWIPVLNDEVDLDLPGMPIRVNRYVVEKDLHKALVLYWYQANGRIIANEYWGKYYLVADALRTGRRDGAILRVVVPISHNETLHSATTRATVFAQKLIPLTKELLPI